MEPSEKVIGYLMESYQPNAIILYGSFADGSANAHSDFDALVIADHIRTHDASTIGDTVLDVFVYPTETFESDFDPEAFVQIFDGRIILDKFGIAARLQRQILDHLDRTPKKTDDEIRQALDWCEKMVARTARGDAEGLYRWHWLLTDSLEIYCDLRRLRYFGPKKALRQMEHSDAEAFRLYSRALRAPDREALSAWIDCLKRRSRPGLTGAP